MYAFSLSLVHNLSNFTAYKGSPIWLTFEKALQEWNRQDTPYAVEIYVIKLSDQDMSLLRGPDPYGSFELHKNFSPLFKVSLSSHKAYTYLHERMHYQFVGLGTLIWKTTYDVDKALHDQGITDYKICEIMLPERGFESDYVKHVSDSLVVYCPCPIIRLVTRQITYFEMMFDGQT